MKLNDNLAHFGRFKHLGSDRINPIPFHERSASQCTSLEYQQHGNRSNLKIHVGDFKPVFSEKKFLRSPQDPPKSKKVDFQVTPITLLMVL